MPSPRTTAQNSSTSNAKRAGRGSQAHNKNNLKSDKDNTMQVKPAARRDQFGSTHHDDAQKRHQRAGGTPGGKSDLSFRESAQDLQADRGDANHRAGRRSPKSGDQKHRESK